MFESFSLAVRFTTHTYITIKNFKMHFNSKLKKSHPDPPWDMYPPRQPTPALPNGSSHETTCRYPMMLCCFSSSGLWTCHFFCLESLFPSPITWILQNGLLSISRRLLRLFHMSALRYGSGLLFGGCSLLGQTWLLQHLVPCYSMVHICCLI